MIQQLTPTVSNGTETTPTLPKFGWIRVRRKNARGAASPALDEASWTPMTGGPYIVPVTRWIE
jgi:hypothetical protein